MEWVEVRGETLEAAKEEALDQLGVAHDDAEFEVVQEPESRWLGFKKTEARVRARVRPTQPRPKRDARGSRRPRRGRGGQGNNRGGENRQQRSKGSDGGSKGSRSGGNRGNVKNKNSAGNKNNGDKGRQDDNRKRREQATPKGDRSSGASADKQRSRRKEEAVSEETREAMPLEQQQAAVVEFLNGLSEGFGLEATASTSMDDDIIIGGLEGSDLGLMIGPKGGTMHAIQELARSAVQRQSEGRDTARLMIDVAGYRERRRAALREFAHRQAEQVKSESVELALEPMSSADRKAVHDAIMDFDGVRSISEGDEPRRRVVLLPESD